MQSKGNDIEKMGSKAYRLSVMKDNGISVPEFFCIGSDEVLTENSLKERLKSTLGKIDETQLFSVRSSATCEDTGKLSFAGQFKSFLNVRENGIFKGIIACRESLNNESVLQYLKSTSVSIDEVRMNVIVQRMISADYSGVGFSSNPAGLLNEAVIVCGEGTGDGVVEDKTATTAYYYNKTDNLYYYEESDKKIDLSEVQIKELVEIMEQISLLFGEPIDMEFSIQNNKLWVLQARPITTISTHSKPIILDNSNIVESYPGITLPLTESFISQAYYMVFKGVAKRSTTSKKIIDKYDEVFKEMLGSANGRIYYKISNWYTLIQFLPFYKKIIPVWQDMMGVSHSESGIGSKRDATFWQSVKINLNAIHTVFTVSKQMDKLNRDFSKIQVFFNANYNEQLNNMELKKVYNGLVDMVFTDWDITLLNDMYTFVFTGLLKNRLKKYGFGDEDLIRCISGMSNIESLKPIKELLNISLEVSGCSDFKEKLMKIKSDSDYRQFENSKFTEQEQKLIGKIESYLTDYGDRSLEELKLESKTFRESPILLVGKILDYSKNREKLLAFIEHLNDEKINFTSNIHGLNKQIINLFSNKAMKGIKNREISRLNRSRLYGMARKIFLTAGKNLYAKHQIEEQSDVFYLTVDQVFSDSKNDYKGVVAERKITYEMYAKLPAYSRLIFAGQTFNKVHLNINRHETGFNKTGLSGTPCSAGEVIGEALVINSPSFRDDVKGKILVTKMTDPGWVFLLASADGIVSEKGSLLSHTAIISRELKIPSVVGVKNITSVIKSGDIIRINGSTGRIDILKSAGEGA